MAAKLLILLFALSLIAVGISWGLSSLIRRRRRGHLDQAHRSFSLRREWLEADFFKRAAQSGKPRGLAWSECDFGNDVTFARDRANGQLRALVSVTIGFRAIEGGGMEDVKAVGNLRSATAVFHLSGEQWTTDGRAIFNLDPVETIRHFQHELELA